MSCRIRHLKFLLACCLAAGTLVACVGINKTKQNIAVYDFGLSLASESNQQLTSKIHIEQPIATESLNHNKIRYRLNYQNPARIFFYAESRWAATPSELFSNKLSKMLKVVTPSRTCSLKIQIETFDHVFKTATTSEGIVQLSAMIVKDKSQTIISSHLVTENVTSPSSNAQGGTFALQQASENALRKVISWGNTVAENSGLCQ